MNNENLILLWNNNKAKIISSIRKDIKRVDIADDVLQEVFIKFWENHNTIKDTKKVTQWLLRVSKYTIADYFREKQLQNKGQELLNKDICPPQNSDNTPATDESKQLLPIVHSLPKKYANILLLSDIHGFSHKAISDQFGLSEACIRKRVQRGRKLLAEKMHACCTFTHDKYGNIIECSEKSEYLKIVREIKENI